MNDTSLLKNLSGLRNLPDLLTSENLAKGVEIMKRPAAIAIVASIGIHGLLGLSFPMISSSSSPKDKQTPVKLVDLTPSEQSKLPQSPTSGIALPPLSGPTFPTTTNSAAGNLFKLQPTQSPFYNASSPTPASTLTTPNNSLFASSVRPTIISPDYFLNGFQPSSGQAETPPPPTTPTPSPSPTTSPLPTPSPSPTTSPLPDPTTPPATPNPTTPAAASPAELELAAKNQQARRLAGVKIAQQLSLAQQGGGTSSSVEDFADRYAKWQAKLLTAGQGRITPEDLTRETTPYPEPLAPIECQSDACDGKSVIFVVAIDPQGQLLGDPGVIRTTGDKTLDQAATQVFLNLLPNLQKPPAKNRPTLYAVSIDFTARRPS
jgi:hypothetical protein